MTANNATGEQVKFTAYFGERVRHGSRFVSDDVLDLCTREAVAISVVMRGAAGFGPRHDLRSDQSLSASEDLPVTVTAVDGADKIERLAQQAGERISRGLITLERVQVPDPSTLDGSRPTKLTIYLGRRQRISEQPAYRAVCALLRAHGFDSATVLLGVDGTVRGERRRARFFGANTEVPLMVVAVGTAAGVAAVLPSLKEWLPDPAMTVERVQLCKRDGVLLATPEQLPTTDGAGRPIWQKLVIHTSEADRIGREPIHRAIVRSLREDRSGRGVTVLRGIWGFYGDRNPHGDKLIQLGRNVPVTTIVVDSPDRIATHFATIDELTSDLGVVTAERVPALVSIDGEVRYGNVTLAHFE